MTLSLQVGRKYRTRDGNTVYINSDHWADIDVYISSDLQYYYKDGKVFNGTIKDSAYDIIEELTHPENVLNKPDKVNVLIEALEVIAAYNDISASNYFKDTGSYSCFDEPGSVEIARKALASYKGDEE